MKPSPFLFFLIKDGKLLIWDYKLHNQFIVTGSYLKEIIRSSAKKEPSNLKIYKELIENSIIVDDQDRKYNDENWEWDELAKIFHIGTQDIIEKVRTPEEYSQDYLNDCEKKFKDTSDFLYERAGTITHLPKPDFSELKQANLFNTLQLRRTSRNFHFQPTSLVKISTLLKVTFGCCEYDSDIFDALNLLPIGQRKTSPSGGGLHPSEAYLLALNIEGLKTGIYYYHTKNHYLVQITDFDFPIDLKDILCGQYFSNNLSAGIFITSVFSKQWLKYKHSRAYRIALLDAGHLSQTFLLCSTAMGFSTWISGAFDDSQVCDLLKIQTIAERPILFLGVGHGDNSPIDIETMNILNK